MQSNTIGRNKLIELILRKFPSAFTDLFGMNGRKVKFSHVQIRRTERHPDVLIVVDGKESCIFKF